MKGKVVFTRPNRKVTDFFQKIPKTGPRADQPVYEISSSSDRSIISISSGELPTKGSSQPALISNSSPRVAAGAGDSRQPGATRSAAVSVSSSPQSSIALLSPDCTLSTPSEPSVVCSRTRSDDVSSAPKPSSKQQFLTTSMPKNNAKKRKQPSIHVISSEDSDEPTLPVIRVKPSSRDNKSPARETRSRSHPSICAVMASSSAIVPLSPRHNTLSTSKCSLAKKPESTAPPPASRAKVSEKHNSPSPPKRARHNSISVSQTCALTAGDADDEREDEDESTAPARRQSWKTVSTQSHSDDDMDVDSPTSPLPPVSRDGIEKTSSEEFNSCNGQTQENTTSPEDVVPSSQHDEAELSIGDDVLDANLVQARERKSPISPSNSRAEDIIARIKAEAEAEAVAQPQLDLRRSLGLWDSEGGLSDLSSISSSSDDDDEGLELKLSMYSRPSVPNVDRFSPSLDTKGTRRSARNENVPPPNYAKKLELFRDDSPPPSKKESVHNVKHANTSCPLDVLLKDFEREGARQAKAEKKRKGHYSTRGVSPAATNQHSGTSQSPSRPGEGAGKGDSGSDIASNPETTKIGDDSLMGDEMREELLGKDDADAVGKILAGDRMKGHRETKEIYFTFWNLVQQGCKEVVPDLSGKEQNFPTFQMLCDKLKQGEYETASLLINTGILQVVPYTLQLIEWLFLTAMSTANTGLSTAAYRALLVSQHEHSGEFRSIQLDSIVILTSLFKFGVDPQISALLGNGAMRQTMVVEANKETKLFMVYRLVVLLEALGCSNSIQPDAMPSTIVSLLLLALDLSTSPELQQDIICAIEGLLSSSVISRGIEMRICKFIVHATSSMSFVPQQEARLLTFLSGCGPSSGRVRRWTAWAMLGGELSGMEEIGDIPPLEVFASLFTDQGGSIRLEVGPDTDYEALCARVEILSVALTDVDARVRLDWSAKGSSSGSIDGICKALESMNGKIVDTRAAHLDRTRTKDAINRLSKRLLYQRHATLELIRGSAGKMDGFITKHGSKIKPKPKPTIAAKVKQGDILAEGETP